MRTREDLRDVQVSLIDEMENSLDLQVVLGMGGGKTVSALTAFDNLRRAGDAERLVVLAPVRVRDAVWPVEPGKWEHLQHLRVAVVDGTPKQRAARLREPADVYVVSIDVTQWLVDEMKKLGTGWMAATVMAIDELSRFKSPRSKRGQKLARVTKHFNAVWGLTGTPRPNGWEDQWMPLRLISRGEAWGGAPFDTWRRQNFMPLDFNGYRWQAHEFAIPKIRAEIDRYTIHVPDVDMGVPDLNEGEDFEIRVALTDEARATYERMLEDLLAELRGEIQDGWSDEDVIAALSAAVQSSKLEQITQGFLYDAGATAARLGNAKRDALADTLEDVNENVIICYKFREDIAQLREIWPDLRVLGGGEKDPSLIDDWNAGKVARMALHPASAGHGIELQFGGRRMVWYTPTWSPELYEQTVKRLHRPGQKLPVFVHQLVARETVDEIKVARAAHKVADQQAFIGLLRKVRP